MDYLVAKHALSYEQHLEEVLTFHDARMSEALRENHRLEWQLGARLQPEIARRRAQLERLRVKSAAAEQRVAERQALAAALQQAGAHNAELEAALQQAVARNAELEAAVQQAGARNAELEAALQQAVARSAELAAEVAKLHASTSWRLTAPMRAIMKFIKRQYRGY
jgi:predicted  nucleic acid-binding Zn-ribbon protein